MKSKNKMATMKLEVRETAVIPYPDADLKELVKLLDMDGMLTTIKDNTGVTAPTVRDIVKYKRGQKAKVDKLVEFTKAFKIQFAQRA